MIRNQMQRSQRLSVWFQKSNKNQIIYLDHIFNIIDLSFLELFVEIEDVEPDANSNVRVVVGANLMPPVLWDVQHVP